MGQKIDRLLAEQQAAMARAEMLATQLSAPGGFHQQMLAQQHQAQQRSKQPEAPQTSFWQQLKKQQLLETNTAATSITFLPSPSPLIGSAALTVGDFNSSISPVAGDAPTSPAMSNRLAELMHALAASERLLLEKTVEADNYARSLRACRDNLASEKADRQNVEERSSHAILKAMDRELEAAAPIDPHLVARLESQVAAVEEECSHLKTSLRDLELDKCLVIQKVFHLEEENATMVSFMKAQSQAGKTAVHDFPKSLPKSAVVHESRIRNCSREVGELRASFKAFCTNVRQFLSDMDADMQAMCGDFWLAWQRNAVQSATALNRAETSLFQLGTVYKEQSNKSRQLEEKIGDLRGAIRVCGRVHPRCKHMSSTPSYTVRVENNNTAHVGPNHNIKSYALEHIYSSGSDDTLSAIAGDICSDMIGSVLTGHNVTLMAYGETGSGKSSLLEGSRGDAGLIQRAMSALFDHIDKQREQRAHEFAVTVKAVEVFREEMRDLLLMSSDSTSAVSTGRSALAKTSTVEKYGVGGARGSEHVPRGMHLNLLQCCLCAF